MFSGCTLAPAGWSGVPPLFEGNCLCQAGTGSRMSNNFEKRRADKRWGRTNSQGDGTMPRPSSDMSADAGPESRTPLHRLTAREVEVLDLAAYGFSNRQISDRLFLSEHTVLGYMKSIFSKFSAHSKVQAVVMAIGEGIIGVPDFQVWSDDSPRASGHLTDCRDHYGHRLAAIMFSDIVGFTSLMGDDEAATMRIVEANDRIHDGALRAHSVTVLKKLGDGMLASFDSVFNAVACASAIRLAVSHDGRFQVRIGVHLGEVVLADGDVHGDGVNIAARIQGEVAPGQIGLSRVVYENIKNKDGLTATLLGERNLKNVSTPIVLYTLDPQAPAASARRLLLPQPHSFQSGRSQRYGISGSSDLSGV